MIKCGVNYCGEVGELEYKYNIMLCGIKGVLLRERGKWIMSILMRERNVM